MSEVEGGFAVKEPRRCAFIEERQCNFEADQISMDFCKVCIDAWKASGGAKGAPQADKSKEKLTQIDALFQRGGDRARGLRAAAQEPHGRATRRGCEAGEEGISPAPSRA
ncbi:MAG: hypothetical protein NTV61_04710 [Candidatus Bathyarchaeota archaeon]|nr:hypothetical protein [Candidatus Bathyarchaeota archaeon]